MHSFIPTPELLHAHAPADWWGPTSAELDRLAAGLLGQRPGGWVRRGTAFVVVAKVKFGSLAAKLPEDLRALATETQSIRALGNPEGLLQAAAFFHLRFENVHPLHEGNGRIGRTLLAAQLHAGLNVPIEQTLRGVERHQPDYMAVFAAWTPQLSYHNLVKLLGRIAGVTLPIKDYELPASLEPLHPTPGSPLRGPPSGTPARPPARAQPQIPFWRARR